MFLFLNSEFSIISNTFLSGFIQASLCKIQGLFKDFLQTFLLFSKPENLYKILMYTLKYYFGNVGLLYIQH